MHEIENILGMGGGGVGLRGAPPPRSTKGVSTEITMLISVILCLEILIISDKLRFHNVSVYAPLPKTPSSGASRISQRRGTNPKRGHNLLLEKFSENGMKIKKFWPRGGVPNLSM